MKKINTKAFKLSILLILALFCLTGCGWEDVKKEYSEVLEKGVDCNYREKVYDGRKWVNDQMGNVLKIQMDENSVIISNLVLGVYNTYEVVKDGKYNEIYAYNGGIHIPWVDLAFDITHYAQLDQEDIEKFLDNLKEGSCPKIISVDNDNADYGKAMTTIYKFHIDDVCGAGRTGCRKFSLYNPKSSNDPDNPNKPDDPINPYEERTINVNLNVFDDIDLLSYYSNMIPSSCTIVGNSDIIKLSNSLVSAEKGGTVDVRCNINSVSKDTVLFKLNIKDKTTLSGTSYFSNLDYNSLCSNKDIKQAVKIVGYIVVMVKWIIPFMLIILGMVDFGKATISNDEKALKTATGTLLKRIIAGVIVFFIPTIMLAILNIVKVTKGIEDKDNEQFGQCTKCLFDPFNQC